VGTSTKLSRVKDNNAIYYHNNYGPQFGHSGALYILCNEKKEAYCASSSSYDSLKYEKGYFTIVDYEVFHVVKKIT
ncbi:16089_t:CDS:1, partial [Acaulospora morrowiae]